SDIWPLVLFFTGIATMVVCVTKFTTTNLGINSVPLTVIGTVVSLVVSFKTNNSYSRWWDGQNIWANITSNSRQLAMIFWIQVGVEPEEEAQAKERAGLGGLIEKKTYIGLILAFSVAMKHALRGELGPFYSDLYPLIAFLPKENYHTADEVVVPLTQAATKFDGSHPDNEKASGGMTTQSSSFQKQRLRSTRDCLGVKDTDEPDIEEKGEEGPTRITNVELMPPRHPPPTRYYDIIPPLRIIKIVSDVFKKAQKLDEQERVAGGKRRHPGGIAPGRIPQQIVMYLSAYISSLVQRQLLSTSLISPALNCIQELQKAISDLEKLATTPIPSAYVFHLRLTVWMYLAALPFQLVQYINWVTIPVVAMASIIYLGFLEIGAQIELPFAYDQSDLDLDKFVIGLQHQLAEVTAFPTSVPTDFVVHSHLNQPFLPTLSLNVEELLGISTSSEDRPSSPDSHPNGGANGVSNGTEHKTLPKSMKDLEVVLSANWREIREEARYLGRRREQLENRTGLEIAVLHL
ncbi:hypothetical protein TREMEDRAFT_31453, partial [Tremella mesenterica DSM 1558]|uniref:uncharacterized protein n=1 Tax=Tremella mesenterica (strain ATCC 24925 / CBS 8224 / DSM 1558 / NBRC 9311 / NRRL Y-6157 / RJB 2259-6 / UBC 559-6) TaxID=578456 RepID=UPI0003F4908A